MALPHNRYLPILQGLIINKAPPRIIKSTTHQLTASINTADSSGRYPIDVAIRHGLAWDGGMKELVEKSGTDLLEREDVTTGLLPFMAVAVGEDKYSYDLNTVFHLIKKTPLLVRRKLGKD